MSRTKSQTRPKEFLGLRAILPHEGVKYIIPLAIGFLHYDSDRGGAQESDRTGNYRDAAEEIVPYLQRGGNATKLLFINDGPGLLAGKMWRMYADIEALWKHRIQVNTLKMLPHRLTLDWLLS